MKVEVNCVMSLFPLFLLRCRDFGWTSLSHRVPPLLYFPAKCPRAAPWRRFTWMGSPPPLVWWRWDGTRSWASASWRAVRNRWWSVLSRQVGNVHSCNCVFSDITTRSRQSQKLSNPIYRGFESYIWLNNSWMCKYVERYHTFIFSLTHFNMRIWFLFFLQIFSNIWWNLHFSLFLSHFKLQTQSWLALTWTCCSLTLSGPDCSHDFNCIYFPRE